MRIEIKPHHEIFLSCFIQQSKSFSIVSYDDESCKISVKKVRDTEEQAKRNIKIIEQLKMPLMSIYYCMTFLYGEAVTQKIMNNY